MTAPPGSPAVTRAWLRVEHETRYDYETPVACAQHVAHLQPLDDDRQHLQAFELLIDPPPAHGHAERDEHGNWCHRFTIEQPHRALRVSARSVVAVAARAADLRPETGLAWETVRDRPAPGVAFTQPSPHVPWLQALRDWAVPSLSPGRPAAEAALELMHRLHAEFTYRPHSTRVDTPLAEVFAQRQGVCQDFAHLLIGAWRAHGLAARYVSGYLLTEPAPGQPRLLGADASHAWVQLWCPGTTGVHADGWLDLDPTNDCVAGCEHVRVAAGRDYGDVAPLGGVLKGGGAHRLAVAVSTCRVPEPTDQEGPIVASLPSADRTVPMQHPYDEMRTTTGPEPRSGADIREHYRRYEDWLRAQPAGLMRQRRDEAEMIFRRVGITFAVYGEKDEDGAGTERLIPFDLIPRVIPRQEWRAMEAGLRQRVQALNRFIEDVYHGQEILRAGVVPAEVILRNAQYRPEMAGVQVPGGIYSHVSGIDIVRAGQADGSGTYYVLEDNLRVPSGVSYMLENRKMMMRLFPELFSMHRVAPVAHYPDLLLETLRAVAPAGVNEPVVVVLTPGMYNSAYFEHAFLAQQMGVELLEGQDLFVSDDFVYMRTTQGPRRVDVIYRRVDDDFLDPLAFRPDSTLGCAGLLDVYRRGNVTLCNAIGTGIADDKSIYPYVPKMIEFYLGEKPILHNVPTWLCRDPEDLRHVLDHLGELVVKEVHGAGGYGMLVGPAATRAQIEAFRARLLADPSNYIAQPTLSLSTCPTFVESGVAPRHIDLRPYVLSSGKGVQTVPGGLTRVALKEGSLVVNSSQGGGTKDTWVLED